MNWIIGAFLVSVVITACVWMVYCTLKWERQYSRFIVPFEDLRDEKMFRKVRDIMVVISAILGILLFGFVIIKMCR